MNASIEKKAIIKKNLLIIHLGNLSSSHFLKINIFVLFILWVILLGPDVILQQAMWTELPSVSSIVLITVLIA